VGKGPLGQPELRLDHRTARALKRGGGGPKGGGGISAARCDRRLKGIWGSIKTLPGRKKKTPCTCHKKKPAPYAPPGEKGEGRWSPLQARQGGKREKVHPLPSPAPCSEKGGSISTARAIEKEDKTGVKPISMSQGSTCLPGPWSKKRGGDGPIFLRAFRGEEKKGRGLPVNPEFTECRIANRLEKNEKKEGEEKEERPRPWRKTMSEKKRRGILRAASG